MPKGGKRSGSGRPKLGDKKLKMISLRVSQEQHAKLKKKGDYGKLIREFVEGLL
jgi:hypothetical protein